MKNIVLFMIILLATGGLAMAGEMSVDEWSQYNQDVTEWFETLAVEVHSGEALPIKCATPILTGLIASQPKGVDSKILYVEREDTMSFTYGTDHFLLHYTSTGDNRVYDYDTQTLQPGVPDYIVMAGRICDSVWGHTVGALGFTQPVSDGFYNGGGDGRLDVYFIDFPAYGATVRDSIRATVPLTSTTYMFLENDYADFPGYESNRLNALRVAMAHEFFHSVQFAIDLTELEGTNPDLNPAWIEMSATYMEEEHYPAIDDYINYLIFFYKVPQWSVRTGTVLGSPSINYWRNLHMYGSVVFPLFLSRRFDPSIIKDIWDGCGAVAGPNWWLAADASIKSASGNTSTLEDEYQEFALWNLFTRQRAKPATYFPDGADYDTVSLAARLTTYPATVTPIDSVRPDNLGANYIMLENVASVPTGLAVAFSASKTYSWGITVVGLHNNISLPIKVEHIKYDTLTSTISIPDAAQYDRLVLIVSVLDGNDLKLPYTLTVSPMGEGVTQPNGGEVLFTSHPYDIIWYLTDAGDNVRIEFSANNGGSWSEIAVTENNLAYEWMVPSSPSDSCLIKVSDVADPDIFDVSDSVFSIVISSNNIKEPFPNPAWVQKDIPVTFMATYGPGSEDRPGMMVTIMTLAGEKVIVLEGEILSGFVKAEWNFTNNDGRKVAAGPYLALIEFQGETTVKKFVVLR